MSAPLLHRVRANLFTRETEWRFADGRLAWRALDDGDGTEGSAAARDVTEIRLTREAGARGAPRLFCRLRLRDGRRLLIASADQSGVLARQDRSATFRPLAAALVAAVRRENPQARFRRGSGPVVYWGGVVGLAGVALAVAALAATRGAGVFTPKLLLGLALVAFGLPNVVRWMRDGRPGTFDPARPPLD